MSILGASWKNAMVTNHPEGVRVRFSGGTLPDETLILVNAEQAAIAIGRRGCVNISSPDGISVTSSIPSTASVVSSLMGYIEASGKEENPLLKIKAYTGIGSRRTPREVCLLMTDFAAAMAKHGIMLRSGAARGADQAFETGCDMENGPKQIFLPWQGFNDSTSRYYTQMEEAFAVAAGIHPAWNRLQQAAQRLHARNIHQVLGPSLDDPSGLVVCWTPDGEITGGTATAIKLAMDRGITVLNLAIPEQREMAEEIIHDAPKNRTSQ